MFPAPSPNSQAIFNSLQSGGATPSTLDFHRTAMNARAASQANNTYNNNTSNGQTSQPQEQNNGSGTDAKQFQPPTSQPQGQSDIFGQGDANDAANGLYMLAQANGGRNNNQQFAMPQQPAQNMSHMGNSMNQQGHDTTPQNANRGGNKASIGSISTGPGMSEAGDFSESGNSEPNKPAPKSKGKKGSAGKNQSNGRRKAEETPSKQPANKRQKGNSVIAANQEMEMDDSDDGGSVKQEGEGGRKMTDEEKRKNFLERNRYVVLCRLQTLC